MIIRLTKSSMEVKEYGENEIKGNSIVIASGLNELLDESNLDLKIELVDKYGVDGVLNILIPERSTDTHLIVDVPRELKGQVLAKRERVNNTEDVDILYKKKVGVKIDGNSRLVL